MKKEHSEEAVCTSLMRKRIFFTWHETTHREHGKLSSKTIVISNSSQHVGIRTLGKLDYMRKMGWGVVDNRRTSNSVVTTEEKGKEALRKIISKPKVLSTVTYGETSQLH